MGAGWKLSCSYSPSFSPYGCVSGALALLGVWWPDSKSKPRREPDGPLPAFMTYSQKSHSITSAVVTVLLKVKESLITCWWEACQSHCEKSVCKGRFVCASLENTIFCNQPCTYNSYHLHMPNMFFFPKTLKSKHPLVSCHLRSQWRLDSFSVVLLAQLLNLRNCEHKRQALCSPVFYSLLFFLSFIDV